MTAKHESLMAFTPHDHRVVINVGGRRYETLETTLQRLPQSLLGDFHRRAPFFDASRGEFFFDRSSDSFDAVLNVYRTGAALKPEHVPLKTFLDDLHFYGLTEYAEPIESQHGLLTSPSVESAAQGWRQKLWSALEPAPGSFPVVPALSTLLTFAIIVTWMVLTLPALEDHVEHGLIAQTVFAVIVLLELLVRFICSPNVLHLIEDPLTWLDLIGSIAFFFGFGFKDTFFSGGSFGYVFIRMARLAWALRLWRLMRHTRSAALIRRALLKSTPALAVYVLIWLTGVLFFAPLFFWTESRVPGSVIESAPAALYFTIVTMTTVGYGDITPVTAAGKVVGCVCAYFGCFMLALPVAVVVAAFVRLSALKRT